MNSFARIITAAQERGLACLVIGGHAVNAHGYSRPTYDLDFLVERTRLAEWRTLLTGLGYQEFHDGETFLQFEPPTNEDWKVDLMHVTADTFQKLWGERREETLRLGKAMVPCLNHLLALKLHALKHTRGIRGIKDMDDVLHLVETNSVDVTQPELRALFLKFGTEELYERIRDHCAR